MSSYSGTKCVSFLLPISNKHWGKHTLQLAVGSSSSDRELPFRMRIILHLPGMCAHNTHTHIHMTRSRCVNFKLYKNLLTVPARAPATAIAHKHTQSCQRCRTISDNPHRTPNDMSCNIVDISTTKRNIVRNPVEMFSFSQEIANIMSGDPAANSLV